MACGILDQYTSVLGTHDSMTGAPGLIARRQADAGFGGCLVAIVDRWELGEFAQS